MGSISTLLTKKYKTAPEYDDSCYRVFLSFCLREPTSNNTNISNWIECYKPSTDTWTYVSLVPGINRNHVLKGFAMVSLGDYIYIIGGRRCLKEMSHVSDELADLVDKELEVLSTVLRYNLRTDEWSNCSPLCVARSDFACTVFDNKIYIAGGQSALGSARGIASAEVYDPKMDEWKLLPSMSTLRYKCVGVGWNGKIHVVGGFVERLDSDRASPFIVERSSAEVFDPETETWELQANMWQLDVPPNQIVAVDGKLFSSGDCLKAWKGHIEAYDPVLNIWNEVVGSNRKALSFPSTKLNVDCKNWAAIQQQYLTMSPVGDHLYFLAGYQTMGDLPRTVSMVHVFDTTVGINAWRSFEPMEEEGAKELCSHCCVALML